MEQTYQDKPVYLTQRELARRWRVTGGTIIKWRKKGFLSYLKLMASFCQCAKLLIILMDSWFEKVLDGFYVSRSVMR